MAQKKYASLSTLQTFLDKLKNMFATKTEVDEKSAVEMVTMGETESSTKHIPTLKIHKLSQEQYDEAVANGNIDESALYLTPDPETYTQAELDEMLDGKAESSHNHSINDLTDYTVDTALSSTSANPVANSVLNAKFEAMGSTLSGLSNTVSTNYDETIIGLSVDGTTVTYIKGDGSVHTFETQDTNTEYFLATDEVTGLTKLYATTGYAEDGTMTQKAIKTELDKKVGVSVDDAQDTLVFTI